MRLIRIHLAQMLWPMVLFVASVPLTGLAYFYAPVPFWMALVPLGFALWFGGAAFRAAGMAGYLFWPVVTSVTGLIGIGVNGFVVVVCGVLILSAICVGAAFIGVIAASLLMTAVHFFPASPVLPFADLLPHLGRFGITIGLAVFIAIVMMMLVIDHIQNSRLRRGGFVVLIGMFGVWNVVFSFTSSEVVRASSGIWHERVLPVTINSHTQWLAARNSTPHGSTIVLGENIFSSTDSKARAFWCDAAINKDLTVVTGVEEPYRSATRGTVWRFDKQSCREGKNYAVYKARVGVPGLTGTLEIMDQSLGELGGARSSDSILWFVCMEAFLPRVWFDYWMHHSNNSAAADFSNRDAMIVANDSTMGSLPVDILRIKAATAMSSMFGFGSVYHARTGETLLQKTSQSLSFVAPEPMGERGG